MKIRFYLRKSTKNYSIYFEFRNSNESIRVRTSTGFILQNAKQWDSQKERIKLPSSILGAADINLKLSESLFKFNKFLSTIDENEISELVIQKFIKEDFGKKNESLSNSNISKNLIEYYEWFLDFYSKNNSPYTKKTLSIGTITTYRSALTRLKLYLDESKIKKFSFEDCNRTFYNDYINFLTNKNYSKNYIGTMIQKLKTIIGSAYDEGLHTNAEFKKNYFSKMSEQIDHVYLTIEELQKIKDLKLDSTILDTVRDIFLIGCYTGLRISDTMCLLKKTNQTIFVEDGIKYFHIKQIKTSNSVIIPLNKIINEILSKRDGNLPDYLHQNIINQHIKSICKRAKITENHTLCRTEGGKTVEYNLPKYKLVASHTARRSFCTNAYKSGMPIQDIMAISGHKSERVFLNYVKVEKAENAKRISKHAFFN